MRPSSCVAVPLQIAFLSPSRSYSANAPQSLQQLEPEHPLCFLLMTVMLIGGIYR
ncbi:TPA: hypothetical protein O4G11_001335 [Proteus mirabilis]|nr:hypothetical protein [Proteus mirabilis]